VGLGTDKPNIRVPGTKTAGSDRTIAMWKFMVPVYERNIENARAHGRRQLWPYSQEQLRNNWMDVRVHLGVEKEPTSTMKALRRTFAWFAKTRNLSDTDIKHILGHSDIHTTEGYLRLFGDPGMELSRERVDGAREVEPERQAGNWLTDAIRAYKEAVDPSPGEMALFVKTLKE
jgi:integrase